MQYRLYYNHYSIAPVTIDKAVEFIHNEEGTGRATVKKQVVKAAISLDEQKLKRAEIKLNDTFFGWFLEKF